MIKLESVTRQDEDGLVVELASDNKEEVIAMGNKTKNVLGMQDGIKMGMSSSCFTANQELGMLSSIGWKF